MEYSWWECDSSAAQTIKSKAHVPFQIRLQLMVGEAGDITVILSGSVDLYSVESSRRRTRQEDSRETI